MRKVAIVKKRGITKKKKEVKKFSNKKKERKNLLGLSIGNEVKKNVFYFVGYLKKYLEIKK